MSTKFKIWVDDTNLDNVQPYSAFVNDTQRSAGFQSGQPASSIRVNTALRQANLIACALMQLADPSGTCDFRSSVDDIAQSLLNYFTNFIPDNAYYAQMIGRPNSHPAIGADEQSIYVNSNGEVIAGNYIPKLNGTKQTSSASFYAPTSVGTGGYILRSNGTGAPEWINSISLSAGSAINDGNGNNIASTYAKKSDFNTSSQTKFGDYIFPKYKLLCNTSTLFVDNATFTLSSAVSSFTRLYMEFYVGNDQSFRYVNTRISAGTNTNFRIDDNGNGSAVDCSVTFPTSTSMKVVHTTATSSDDVELLRIYQVIGLDD